MRHYHSKKIVLPISLLMDILSIFQNYSQPFATIGDLLKLPFHSGKKSHNLLNLFLKHTNLICLFVFATGWLFFGTAFSEEISKPQTLRVIGDNNYPPFLFHDSSGRTVGYVADWWALWEKKTGIHVDLKATDWAEAQQVIARGDADVIDNIFQTPQREPLYDFTKSYAKVPVGIYTHSSIAGIQDIKSLRGFEIGAMAGDACIDMLQLQGISTFRYFNSYASLITGALAEDVKIFCMDEYPANYYLYREGAQKFFQKAFQLYEGEFHRAVRKGDVAKMRLVEQGAKAITSDEDKALRDKWLKPPPIDFKAYRNNLIIAGASLLIITLTLVIWLISTRIVVKNRTTELRESEARFKALHNASFGGITIHDKGLILECNQGLSEITGYSQEELVGMDGLLLIAPSARELVRSKITVGYEKPYEAIGVRKNGEEYPIRLEARNIPYKGKNVRSVEFRDITEYKQIKAEREKIQQQLVQAQKMESVGRLAGGVAHDFNNMLGVILGYSEMVLEQIDEHQPIYPALKGIHLAAQRSAELTRQLLAFARKQTVMPEILDLNETVEGMLKMLGRLIGEDIDLAWMPGKELWLVKIDPSQVDQILANLCVNSRDAIGDTGKVTIETENTIFDAEYCAEHIDTFPGEYVMLAVSDDGCGMDAATQSLVFEPFFTTKETGKGTGLGLAMVYGIVKQNNGFINVYSELGQGTTFKIYLPKYISETDQVPRVKLPQLVETGAETILLVEDEPTILNMTAEMLTRLGYTVLPTSTPSEALNIAQNHEQIINLLMTDVIMPEMNGRDLAKRLLTLRPDIKCIFMSGYTANVIAHHGVLDEGINFLQKPFSKKDLAVKLREVLAN